MATRYSLLELVNRCLAVDELQRPVQTLDDTDPTIWFYIQALNLAQRNLCATLDLDHLRTRGATTFYRSRTALTGTFVSGQSYVTFVGDLSLLYDAADDPVSPYVGAYLRLDGDLFKITAMTLVNGDADTRITLDRPHGQADGTGPCAIYLDHARLPADFHRPLDVQSFLSAPWNMSAVPPDEFMRARQYDSRLATVGADAYGGFMAGTPQIYTTWGTNTDVVADQANKRKLLYFAPSCEETHSVQIHYYRQPAWMAEDTDYPDVPESLQASLIYHAMERRWLRGLDLGKAAGLEALRMDARTGIGGKSTPTSDRSGLRPQTDREHFRR